MLTATHTRARGLADLPPVEPDSLLALIALCNADPRPDKIDVGVGVFRDGAGNTPILEVMKEAVAGETTVKEAQAVGGQQGEQVLRLFALIVSFRIVDAAPQFVIGEAEAESRRHRSF